MSGLSSAFHNERSHRFKGHQTTRAMIRVFLMLGFLAGIPFSSSYATPICHHTLSSPTSVLFSTPMTRPLAEAGFIDRGFRGSRAFGVPSGLERCFWQPRFRSTTEHRSVFCKNQSLYSAGAVSGSASLFSTGSDNTEGNDLGDRDGDGEKMDEATKRKGLPAVVSDFLYGANYVHKNFLKLSGSLYAKTIFFTAPFVAVFFVLLPSLVLSSGCGHRALAVSVQRFLQQFFTILADLSLRFYLKPLFFVVDLVYSIAVAFCRRNLAPNNVGGAWSIRSNEAKKKFYLLIFLSPIMEELVFRLGFYKLWKAMFRPVNSDGSRGTLTNGNDETTRNRETSNQEILASSSDERNTQRGTKTWFIASGAVFAVTHLVNFFPITPGKYRDDTGTILLPSGSYGERFLLALFPSGFIETHREFCLVDMVLFGAIFQGMHCFINTIVMYGPLFHTRGVFASIGAHMAWNANVFWLITNIKCRLVRRLVFAPLFRTIRQRREGEPKRRVKGNSPNDNGKG